MQKYIALKEHGNEISSKGNIPVSVSRSIEGIVSRETVKVLIL